MAEEIQETLQKQFSSLAEEYERTGSWKMSLDKLSSLLSLDIPDTYRILLEHRDLLPLDLSWFNSEEPEQLALFLSSVAGKGISTEMEEAGLFLTAETRSSIFSSFQIFALERLRSHNLLSEDFFGIYDHYGSFPRSFHIYCNEYIPLEKIIRDFSSWFSAQSSIPGSGARRKSIYDYVKRLIRRHIIVPEILYTPLRERLRKYVFGEEEEPRQADTGNTGFTRACAVLEVSPETVTPESAKRSYRRLMKQYHPDINRGGVEKSKEITVAYAFISGYLV